MIHSRDSLFAFAGGVLQLSLGLGLLLLPVFSICMPQGQEMICERLTYLQQGGNALGVAFLLMMAAAGILGIASTRIANSVQVRRFRWGAVILTTSFVAIGAQSLGLIFAPGGIFLLLSALISNATSDST